MTTDVLVKKILHPEKEFKYIHDSCYAIIEIKKVRKKEKVVESFEYCISRFIEIINNNYYLSRSNIIFAARTPSWLIPNKVTLHKGIWGYHSLRWAMAIDAKTTTINAQDDNGTYLMGIANISIDNIRNAIDYIRLTQHGLLLLSHDKEIDQKIIIDFFSETGPVKNNQWSFVISELVKDYQFIVKPHGSFDDREVYIDLIMQKSFIQEIFT